MIEVSVGNCFRLMCDNWQKPCNLYREGQGIRAKPMNTKFKPSRGFYPVPLSPPPKNPLLLKKKINKKNKIKNKIKRKL